MLHTSASGLNRAVSTNRSLVCIETNKEKSLTPAAFIVKWFFLFLYKKGGGCSPQGDSQNKLVCKIDKIYKKNTKRTQDVLMPADIVAHR